MAAETQQYVVPAQPAQPDAARAPRRQAGHPDAHEGLKAAVTKVLKTTWQRCRVHFIRNALAHANKGQRQAVLAMINTIFAQE